MPMILTLSVCLGQGMPYPAILEDSGLELRLKKSHGQEDETGKGSCSHSHADCSNRRNRRLAAYLLTQEIDRTEVQSDSRDVSHEGGNASLPQTTH